jgi:hypothetical protein
MKSYALPGRLTRFVACIIPLTLCVIAEKPALAQSAPNFGPGVRVMTVKQYVKNGYYAGTPTPYCIGNTNVFDFVNSVASALADPDDPSFTGALLDVLNRYHNEIRGGLQLQGWVNQVLTQIYGDESARCNPLVAILPAGSQIVAFGYDAQEANGSGGAPCTLDGNGWYVCGIGFSKFPNKPITMPAGNSLLVTTLFMNWSHDRDRIASMTIYYRPPLWWNQ